VISVTLQEARRLTLAPRSGANFQTRGRFVQRERARAPSSAPLSVPWSRFVAGRRRNTRAAPRSHFAGAAKIPWNDHVLLSSQIERRGAIMWAIINILYREYCLARLTEMRQFELTHW